MKNKRTVIALVVALAMGGLIWAILPDAPDPQMVRVQQLQEKLFDPDAELSPTQRRQAFDELRREAEKLTPQQQDQLIRENPPPPLKRMQQNIVDFFDLPADQQTAMLDKQIDEFERRRQEWQQRAGGQQPPGPPGGNRPNIDMNQMRRRMLDNTSAQQRALFGEYFNRMNQRRQERGLPTMRGFGGL